MAPSPQALDDDFATLSRLCVAIAAGAPVERSDAVTYSQCRATLLGSHYRAALPGCLMQCQSVSKYCEFITLYHPLHEERVRFIEELLAPGRRLHARRPSAVAALRPRSVSDEWTL